MPIGDGTLLRAAVSGAVQGMAGQFGVAPAQAPTFANAVADKVASDPKVANALNKEHPVQSRVVVGSTLALIGGGFVGLAQLVAMFTTGDFDIELAGAAIAAILGAAYSLYGRLRSGLAPLFSRKKA